MVSVKARKITREVTPKQAESDLERYCQEALQQGASTAVIINATDVTVDERVRLKCMVPRCHLYGECVNCPPYTPPVEEMGRIISCYQRAVLFKNDVLPKEDFISDTTWHKKHIGHQRKTHDIVSHIESLAYNDGYYFAAGFAAGGCKTALCAGQVCQFIDSGRCRFPLKSRPSMEGVGIDVFTLAVKVGWDIYPIAHREVELDSIPCAVSIGIVFIL